MCGITGWFIRNPKTQQEMIKNPQVLEDFSDALLLGIEPRGHDATGILSIGPSDPLLQKGNIEASKFVVWRDPLVANARMMLGHTRFATKGLPEIMDNNHPVQYDSTYVIHNGHISNDDELFEEFANELPRYAQVDTEIIPALFAKFGISKAHLALQKLDGTFAVAVADPVRSPDQLLLAKGNGSPLVYIESQDIFIWASTKTAIQDAWAAVIGGKPKEKYFGEMKPGDIKILTNRKLENLRFEVYRRPWQQSYSTPTRTPFSQPTRSTASTWHDAEDYEWVKQEKWKWGEVCECGDTQWWHVGMHHDGGSAKATSGCRKFVKAPLVVLNDSGESSLWTQQVTPAVSQDGEIEEWLRCLACDEFVRKSDCVVGIGGYYVCDDCNVEDGDYEEAETRELAQLTISSGGEIDYDSAKVKKLYDYEVIETARRNDWTPEYVEWMLFTADDEEFDKLPDLINNYVIANDCYNELMKSAVSDIRDAPSARGSEDEFGVGVRVFDGEA